MSAGEDLHQTPDEQAGGEHSAEERARAGAHERAEKRDHETQELIARVREGKESAIDELLDRHRESLRRMIALRVDRALARRVDASDIVQEVLIEANRRLEGYAARPEIPFRIWLRRLAMDRLIDAHRRHRRAKRRSVDREQAIAAPGAFDEGSAQDLIAQLADSQPTPASEAMRHELAARLHLAIERLSDADREVVLLRHFEQMSNQDVAALLDLSEPAAGMRHLRALRRLREVLEADSGDS